MALLGLQVFLRARPTNRLVPYVALAMRRNSTAFSRESRRPSWLWIWGLLAGSGGFLAYRQSGGDRKWWWAKVIDRLKQPQFEKLLPSRQNETMDRQRPTLVIDLDGFLVSHLWDARNNRWRVAKRPGVDMFLYHVGHLYEVVVFSSLGQMTAEPIMDRLDPFRFVSHRVYRFGCRYDKGKYYKELERLNRDPSKVVVLGHDPVFEEYPENFIRVARWGGDPDDRMLEQSLDFLEGLAFARAGDLRPVIGRYREDTFRRYDEKQREVYESMAAKKKEAAQSPMARMLGLLFMGRGRGVELLPYEEKRAQVWRQRRADYESSIAQIAQEYERQTGRKPNNKL